MGPSIFIDGDDASVIAPVAQHDASMGPSIFIDGDPCIGPNYRWREPASMGPSIFIDGDNGLLIVALVDDR